MKVKDVTTGNILESRLDITIGAWGADPERYQPFDERGSDAQPEKAASTRSKRTANVFEEDEA